MTNNKVNTFIKKKKRFKKECFNIIKDSEKPGQETKKSNVKGAWSPEENQLLKKWVEKRGPKNWRKCADTIPGRNGKQCREHWTNSLNESIIKGNWTKEEFFLLMYFYKMYRGSWKKMVPIFKNRTENSIKNKFFSELRKIAAYDSEANDNKGYKTKFPLDYLLQYLDQAFLNAKNDYSQSKNLNDNQIDYFVTSIEILMKRKPKNQIYINLDKIRENMLNNKFDKIIEENDNEVEIQFGSDIIEEKEEKSKEEEINNLINDDEKDNDNHIFEKEEEEGRRKINEKIDYNMENKKMDDSYNKNQNRNNIFKINSNSNSNKNYMEDNFNHELFNNEKNNGLNGLMNNKNEISLNDLSNGINNSMLNSKIQSDFIQNKNIYNNFGNFLPFNAFFNSYNIYNQLNIIKNDPKDLTTLLTELYKNQIIEQCKNNIITNCLYNILFENQPNIFNNVGINCLKNNINTSNFFDNKKSNNINLNNSNNLENNENINTNNHDNLNNNDNLNKDENK